MSIRLSRRLRPKLKDQDPLTGNARRFESLQDRREDRLVGHGPRDVADDHASALASPGQLGQRRRSAWLAKLPGEGRHGVRQRLGRLVAQALDDVAVGQIHFQPGPAIFQLYPHSHVGRALARLPSFTSRRRAKAHPTCRVGTQPYFLSAFLSGFFSDFLSVAAGAAAPSAPAFPFRLPPPSSSSSLTDIL